MGEERNKKRNTEGQAEERGKKRQERMQGNEDRKLTCHEKNIEKEKMLKRLFNKIKCNSVSKYLKKKHT